MNATESQAFVREHLSRLTSHDDWLRALQFARRFHRYSFTNSLLIWAQHETATYVTGFKSWQKLGRSVKKGEKGIRILAPLVRRMENAQDPDGAPIRRCYGFRTVAVFALDQTEGQPFTPPTPQLLTGAGPADAVATLVAQSPVPVAFVDAAVLGGANGDYTLATQAIRVRNDVEPAQQLKTLLHELAHHFGRTGPADAGPGDRAAEEVAAESTAYLACGLLGLDSIAYSAAYVGGWADPHADHLARLVTTIGHRLSALQALLHTAGLLAAEPPDAAA